MADGMLDNVLGVLRQERAAASRRKSVSQPPEKPFSVSPTTSDALRIRSGAEDPPAQPGSSAALAAYSKEEPAVVDYLKAVAERRSGTASVEGDLSSAKPTAPQAQSSDRVRRRQMEEYDRAYSAQRETTEGIEASAPGPVNLDIVL